MVRDSSHRRAEAIGRLAVWTVACAVVLASVTPFVVGVGSAAPNEITDCTVVSSPGVYRFTDSITDWMPTTSSGLVACIEVASSDVVIDGEGFGLDGDAASSAALIGVELRSGVTNVSVVDLRMTDLFAGVALSGTVSGFELSRLTVESSDYGVRIASNVQASDGLIADNVFVTSRTGILTASSGAPIVIENNNVGFDGSPSAGISVIRGRHTIDGNWIGTVATGEASQGIAIDPESSGGDTLVSNNRVTNTRVGIRFTFSPDGWGARFDNNTVRNSSVADFAAVSSSNVATVEYLRTSSGTVSVTGTNFQVDAVDVVPTPPTGLTDVGEFVAVGTYNAIASSPTLTVHYADVEAAFVDEVALSMYEYDVISGAWAEVSEPNGVDPAANEVTSPLSGLTFAGPSGEFQSVFAPLAPPIAFTDDRFEENDDRFDATRLSPGRYDDLTRLPTDDDWYVVSANEGDTVGVSLLFDHAEGDLDLAAVEANASNNGLCYPVLEFDGINFKTATTALSNTTTDDESVEFSPDYGDGSADCGTDVLIRVYGKQPVDSANYTLVVDVSSPGSSVEVDIVENQIRIAVTDVVPGEPLTIPIPDPTGRVQLTELAVVPETDNDFQVQITDERLPSAAPPLAIGDSDGPLMYLTVTHTVPNDEIDSVEFTFTVSEDALETAPADLRLYRFPGESFRYVDKGEYFGNAGNAGDLGPEDGWVVIPGSRYYAIADSVPEGSYVAIPDELYYPNEMHALTDTEIALSGPEFLPGDMFDPADPWVLIPGDEYLPGDMFDADEVEVYIPGEAFRLGEMFDEDQIAYVLVPETGVPPESRVYLAGAEYFAIEKGSVTPEEPGELWTELPTEYLGEVEGGYGYTATAPGFSTFAVGPALPAFGMLEATVTPTETLAGEPVTVSGTVENTGGATGTVELTLTADGDTVTTITATVDPGETESYAFE
jgi:hypothetical protein